MIYESMMVIFHYCRHCSLSTGCMSFGLVRNVDVGSYRCHARLYRADIASRKGAYASYVGLRRRMQGSHESSSCFVGPKNYKNVYEAYTAHIEFL